jgi:hypothetical protein
MGNCPLNHLSAQKMKRQIEPKDGPGARSAGTEAGLTSLSRNVTGISELGALIAQAAAPSRTNGRAFMITRLGGHRSRSGELSRGSDGPKQCTCHLPIAGTLSTMIRGIAKAAVAVAIVSALDKLRYDGRYTDAALAMLRQIQYAFGF